MEKEQMIFSDFWCGLMVPFTYNKDLFKQLGTEKGKNLLPECKAIKLDASILNEDGREIFIQTETNEPMVKGYEITDNKFRTGQLGICQNPKYTYQFRFSNGDDGKVSLDKFKLYFFATGNAFLAVETTTNDIESNHALELNYGLAYMPEKPHKSSGYMKLFYTQKKMNRKKGIVEEISNSFTMKRLIDSFFSVLESFKAVKMKDLKFCYSITGVLLPKSPDEKKLLKFIESRCNNYDKDTRVNGNAETKRMYELSMLRFNDYICWAASSNNLIFSGDLEKAISDKNKKYLLDFKNRLFRHYSFLYLYYLELNMEAKKIKADCRECLKQGKDLQNSDGRSLALKINELGTRITGLCERQEHNHINELFLEALCRESLKLQDMIQDLREEYLPFLNAGEKRNVFISYRRDKGVYLALLISKLLTQLGKTVFLDLESMRSGKFDQQIYDNIDQCESVIALISKGSMERCKNEKDWVRKELAYALKKGKNIIPVFMEGVKGFPETFPEEIAEVKSRQSIPMYIHYFDTAMERLIAYINKEYV